MVLSWQKLILQKGFLIDFQNGFHFFERLPADNRNLGLDLRPLDFDRELLFDNFPEIVNYPFIKTFMLKKPLSDQRTGQTDFAEPFYPINRKGLFSTCPISKYRIYLGSLFKPVVFGKEKFDSQGFYVIV